MPSGMDDVEGGGVKTPPYGAVALNAVIARSTEGTTRQSVILPSRSSHPNAILTGRGGVPPPP